MTTANETFARPIELDDASTGYAVLYAETGEAVTRLPEADTVYPIGSDLSCAYDHPDGIVLTREDCGRLGIEIEEDGSGLIGRYIDGTYALEDPEGGIWWPHEPCETEDQVRKAYADDICGNGDWHS